MNGTFARRQGQIYMDIDLINRALQPMHDFALQINQNSFALTPATSLIARLSISPNQTYSTPIMLNTNGSVAKMDPLCLVQVAIKNNIDILYLTCLVPIHVLFIEDGLIDKPQFPLVWQSIPDVNELKIQINNAKNASVDQIQRNLLVNNVHMVNRMVIDQNEMLFQSIKLTNGILVLAELKFVPFSTTITVSEQLK